ncbi:hypothetical protein BD414DRAFT_413419 [Trametes punicea]|nr:hypothetical protein BD414DRAFT_413419 [Trametes punicea]
MWATGLGLIPTVILLWPRQAHAANFTFSYGTATQCDDFAVSWAGGTAPFQLTLALAYGSTRTLSIPAENFSNGQGSFNTTLPFPAAKQFVAIMSDSTGFASGGVSKLITVGKPSGQNTCNTTDPGNLDFTFEANLALAQCRTYTFDHYDGAVQPITFTGVVPGGTTFVLNPPVGSTSYDWVANVQSGTTLLFIATDSKGRQGGCSQAYQVQLSDDASCLTKDSPASVAHPPSLTTPATSKPTPSKTQSGANATASSSVSATAAPDSGSSSKTSAGTVAAAVIGCLVGAFAVSTLGWFYFRRRRGLSLLRRGSGSGFFGKFQKKEVDLMHDPGLPPPAVVNPYPLYHPQMGSHTDDITPNSTSNLLGGQVTGEHQRVDPYRATASVYAPSADVFAHPAASTSTGQFPPLPPPLGLGHRGSMQESITSGDRDASVTSAMRRKAAAAGVSPYAPSTRFILHTDLEDDPPPPPDDEVIELPPQYSERRVPPPPLNAAAGPSSPAAGGASLSSAVASGSGSSSDARAESGFGRPSSELPPPPPSPSLSASSPGLAYLSDRNSFAPSEYSVPNHSQLASGRSS